MNILTIVITFSLMGVVLGSTFRAYLADIQIKRLTEQSEKISLLITERTCPVCVDTIRVDSRVLNNLYDELTLITRYTDTTFVYIDKNRNIWLSSEEDKSIYVGLDLTDNENIEKILNGNIVVVEGRMSGLVERDSLIVGYPVTNQYTGLNIGAVFLSTPLDIIRESVSDGMKIPIYGMIASALVALLCTYFFSKSISKPIIEMNDAAKLIANGDFEKRINVKAKDEVGQLSESFNNMAKSLEEIEITRREFISNISHDLRSPLTSIIGFLNAMKDGTIEESKKEYYLDIVRDECIRLSKLANDILDISSIQAISNIDIELKPFDINELIKKTLMQFENRIASKSINLEVVFSDNENYVNADFEKIYRVVYNILDNAIKFTQNKGFIKVETTEKEGKIYISIKDSGCGLTKDEQKKIFDRFYKADTSRGHDKNGSGLGLSIAKEFLKAHNEKIFVNSEKGKGCEFIFTLTKC